jgi:hypothetical protein
MGFMFLTLLIALVVQALWVLHITRVEKAELAAGRGTGIEGYAAMAYCLVFAVADIVWLLLTAVVWLVGVWK